VELVKKIAENYKKKIFYTKDERRMQRLREMRWPYAFIAFSSFKFNLAQKKDGVY
jgi:hypothetical protein